MLFSFIAFEIIHFGLMATAFSFFAVWLKHLNFEKGVIVTILSTEATIRLVGFLLAVILSKKSLESRGNLIIFFSSISIVAAYFFSLPLTIFPMIIVTAIFFCGLWVLTPYVEAYCMSVAEITGIEYGKLISIGTLSFIFFSLAGGLFLSKYGISLFPYLLIGLAILQTIFIYFFSQYFSFAKNRIFLRNQRKQKQAAGGDEARAGDDVRHELRVKRTVVEKGFSLFSFVRRKILTNNQKNQKNFSSLETISLRLVLDNKKVLFMILISMFIFGAHGAFGSYTSLLWHANGWSEDTIGFLWGISPVGEFFFFYFFKAKKIKSNFLPLLAFAVIVFSALRFFLTGLLIDNFLMQIVLQISNMLTFSLMHLTVVSIFLREVSSKHFASWQSFYHLAAHGVATALIIPIAGIFYGQFGAGYLYFLGGFCLMSLPLLFFYKRKFG